MRLTRQPTALRQPKRKESPGRGARFDFDESPQEQRRTESPGLAYVPMLEPTAWAERPRGPAASDFAELAAGACGLHSPGGWTLHVGLSFIVAEGENAMNSNRAGGEDVATEV